MKSNSRGWNMFVLFLLTLICIIVGEVIYMVFSKYFNLPLDLILTIIVGITLIEVFKGYFKRLTS